MKPETAAKKLGVLLAATPEEFRAQPVTRSQLNELQENPPEWLAELRRTGPHPRPVVAAKLGVSIAGLARGGVSEPLTTDEIQELLRQKPEWLVREREVHAGVMAENARVKKSRAEAAKSQGA
ncbi:DUF5997 family protein [Naasia sp. SYSU D00057]|uniref:DUF5997 family protein n=1 Tax=Naasia sp. SYSU D00057 TaxID=2817380 RepID=UPI001B3053B5|nr:DUF5997 family protein [Naasia sp. SYSU D00057]